MMWSDRRQNVPPARLIRNSVPERAKSGDTQQECRAFCTIIAHPGDDGRASQLNTVLAQKRSCEAGRMLVRYEQKSACAGSLLRGERDTTR